MTNINFFFKVKRAGRHFGFLKRAGRRALQKRPRQNTELSRTVSTRHEDKAAPYSGNVLLKSIHPVQCWRRVTLSQWYFLTYQVYKQICIQYTIDAVGVVYQVQCTHNQLLHHHHRNALSWYAEFERCVFVCW